MVRKPLPYELTATPRASGANNSRDCQDRSVSTREDDILRQVAQELKTYVYMLIDPRSRTPFYVGKGRGIRFLSHYANALAPVDDEVVDEQTESRKDSQIAEILAQGEKPEVWILRHGMNGVSEYTAVEAAVIDLLMSIPLGALPAAPLGLRENLTNARREHARGHGIRSLQSIVDEYAAPDLATTEPLLLITLNGENYEPDQDHPEDQRRAFVGYKPGWRESAVRVTVYEEIGESVRAWWSISRNTITRRGVRHVVAVHDGVTRALFKINEGSWVEGPERYTKKGRRIANLSFGVTPVSEGPLFDEVIGAHGHRLPMPRRQNALRYWPLRS